MNYFDTDVLIHFIINQDQVKQKTATELLERNIFEQNITLSWLSLQEMLFVLAKLKVEQEIIDKNFLFFQSYAKLCISKDEFLRAYQIALKTSFININDALHTAMAEKACKVLYTFNKKDFVKIQKLSSLKVIILE